MTGNTFWILLGMSLLLPGSLLFGEQEKEEVVFRCDFNSPESWNGWKRKEIAVYHSEGGVGNSGCVSFSSRNPKCELLSTLSLDVEKFKGRGIVLEGWIKAENVATPKIYYHGPKLMLTQRSEFGTVFPDQPKKYGTYGWTKFTAFTRVPRSLRSMTLSIGLQGTSGKIWIDDLKLYLEPLPGKKGEVLRDQIPPNATAQYRGGMSGYDLSEAAFREFREVWNANLMRFQFGRPKHGDNTTVEGFRKIIAENLKKLDAALPFARKYGIKLVLDMHVGPGTKMNNVLSNELSWDPVMQQTLVDVWREIAEKYRGEPMIYGYDLLNEPREDRYVYVPGSKALNWNRLAEKIAKGIREVDPKTPIVIEPACWGGPGGLVMFFPINVPNVIYSIHYYNPGKYTHQGVFEFTKATMKYPGMIQGTFFDKARLEEGLRPAVEFQKQYRVPIYVGEFGVTRWAPNGEQWLDDVISIFEKYGWDWTFHAYREWDGWDPEIGPDKKDRTRIKDTPRSRILKKYMKRNKRFGVQ